MGLHKAINFYFFPRCCEKSKFTPAKWLEMLKKREIVGLEMKTHAF